MFLLLQMSTVDIWTTAVSRGVWKVTGYCRKTGKCWVWAWGHQVLWSVRLSPPSWWSKTGITATDDHGCWPNQMHNVDCDVSCRDEPHQGNASRNILTVGTTTHGTLHKQMLNNVESITDLFSPFARTDCALVAHFKSDFMTGDVEEKWKRECFPSANHSR